MQTILDKSDDELLRILGEYALNQKFSSQPATDGDKEKAGQNFLDRHLVGFRQSICAHPLTKRLLLGQEADASIALGVVMVVVVQVGIFDRAAHEVIHEIAALSALMVRQGLASFCTNVKMSDDAKSG